MTEAVAGRFAPSPTGLLHLGHAYSAILAFRDAVAEEGRFLLRIEDIDTGRARPEFEDAILDDLAWLGLKWEQPVMRQSRRLGAYREALARLGTMNLLYRCYCTRREIAAAVRAPQEGDGSVRPAPYPGFCRPRRDNRPPPPGEASRPFALRLDMRRAIGALGGPRAVEQLGFHERSRGATRFIRLDPKDLVERTGDVVLARKDIPCSYHLAVVVDDAAQGINRVVRGEDLLSATPIHRVLQALLRVPTPRYFHHALIRDSDGKRLAKRDGDASIASLRKAGATPNEIRELLGLPAD